MLLLAVASGNFTLAQFVERLDTQTEGSWFESLQWRLIYLLHVACATVFPSDTVISMRLPVSASVFTAEVWAVIKGLEQIKDSNASKYIVFTDSLSCLQALHLLIGMVIRKCVSLNFAKKDIVFCLP